MSKGKRDMPRGKVKSTMLFVPSHLAYLHDISRARGISISKLLAEVIGEHMAQHEREDALILRAAEYVRQINAEMAEMKGAGK